MEEPIYSYIYVKKFDLSQGSKLEPLAFLASLQTNTPINVLYQKSFDILSKYLPRWSSG